MISVSNLQKGNEYYFYTQNFFWSGFFIEFVDGTVHIKNGHLYYANNIVYAYSEAFLDPSQLIGFAST